MTALRWFGFMLDVAMAGWTLSLTMTIAGLNHWLAFVGVLLLTYIGADAGRKWAREGETADRERKARILARRLVAEEYGQRVADNLRIDFTRRQAPSHQPRADYVVGIAGESLNRGDFVVLEHISGTCVRYKRGPRC